MSGSPVVNSAGEVIAVHGRSDEALTSLDKAIELDPDYALAIENRRLLLEKMNQ